MQPVNVIFQPHALHKKHGWLDLEEKSYLVTIKPTLKGSLGYKQVKPYIQQIFMWALCNLARVNVIAILSALKDNLITKEMLRGRRWWLWTPLTNMWRTLYRWERLGKWALQIVTDEDRRHHTALPRATEVSTTITNLTDAQYFTQDLISETWPPGSRSGGVYYHSCVCIYGVIKGRFVKALIHTQSF